MANTDEPFLSQSDTGNKLPEYPATAAPRTYSFLISVRFLCITLVGFLGTINLFVIRANLSIALPCMVYINTTAPEFKSVEAENNVSVSTTQPGCVRLDNVNTTSDIKVPYTWSSNTRGIVNGAFFVGYFFSQIPASLLFKRFGGRMIMAIFIGISTVCNLLQHPLALLFGRDLAHLTFIILRFFNGIGSGCFFGIYPSILSNWLPKNERSRTISIAFSGLYVGIITAWAVGGWLCKQWGWPIIFYGSGCICVAWLVFFLLLVRDSPEQHPFISIAEKEYILANLGRPPNQPVHQQAEGRNFFRRLLPTRQDLKVILAIIKTPCVWANWVASVTFDYGDFTFLTNIPSYMDEVLYFDIRDNGLWSSVPYIILFIAVIVLGWVFDTIIGSDLLSNIWRCRGWPKEKRQALLLLIVRKFANTVGMIGPAVTLCLLTIADCSSYQLGIFFLCCGVMFQAFSFSGYDSNYFDMGGKYSGQLYAVGNTFAALTGFVSPYLIAKITEHHTHAEWSIAFYITAAVLVIGALIFLIFAKAEVQNFDQAPLETHPPSSTKFDQAPLEISHSPYLTAQSDTPNLNADSNIFDKDL